ncbi:PAS domain S-box protein [bacterium]|nr:MAG: PAS domain S-box protein [bacterium]
MDKKEWSQAQPYLNIVRVIIVSLDTSANIILINKMGCEILGYPEEELIGKNWIDNFIPERMRGEIKSVFNKLISGETEEVKYYENLILAKGGQERIVAWHNALLKDESGKIICTIDAGEDITERKKTEEELHNKIRELEILHKMTVDRELKMMELKSKNTELEIRLSQFYKHIKLIEDRMEG